MSTITADLMSLPSAERRAVIADQDDEDLRLILKAFEAEYGTELYPWVDDPVGFTEDVLGEYAWSKQREVLTSTVANRRTVAVSCHGAGKRIADGTPVLTPDGWRKVETIRPGDRVIGRDGRAHAVEAVYRHGPQPLYRLTWSDGTSTVAGPEHLWGCVVRRGVRSGEIDVRTTADILAEGGRRPTGWERVRLPTVAPVELPTADLPVDPYLLGVILGDGHIGATGSTMLTLNAVDAPDIVSRVGGYARPAARGASVTVSRVVAPAAMRALGLAGRHAHDKFVPDAYLWGDVAQRRALLHGLLDADGNVDRRGAEYATASPALADAVAHLARSLGIQVRRSARDPHYTYRGERRAGRRSYRLRLVGGDCPFSTVRKADAWRRVVRRVTSDRLLVAIDPAEPGPATCLTVDADDGLYVIDDFVVTHNTHIAARAVAHFMSTHPPGTATVVSTAPYWRQVKNLLWPHVHRVHEAHALPGTLNITEWKYGQIAYAFGIAGNRYDESATQGIHNDSVLIVVDEGGGIPTALGRNLDALMTGGDTHMLVIGNPGTDDAGTWFESIAESDLWVPIPISAFDTPNFTGERCPPRIARNLVDDVWVSDVLHQYGEDDPYYIARVLAQFPKVSSRRVIPVLWAERAAEARDDDEPLPDAARQIVGWQRLGVDVASGGGDEMVVAHADGFKVRVVETWSGPESQNQIVNAERILPWIRHAQALQDRSTVRDSSGRPRRVRVKVDADGVGAGTADILEQMGKDGKHDADVVRIRNGQKANEDTLYINRRAEMWWTLRELVRDIVLDLSSLKPDEIKQLTGPMFTDHLHGGRIAIETKEHMKKRGLHSPDRADAIGYAVYEPVVIVPGESYREQMQDRRLPTRIGAAREQLLG